LLEEITMILDAENLYLDDVSIVATGLAGDIIDHWGNRSTDGDSTIPYGTMGILHAHLLCTITTVYSAGTSLQFTLRQADNVLLTTNPEDVAVGPVVVLSGGLDTVGTIVLEAFGARITRRYTGIWATEAADDTVAGGITAGWVGAPQANTPVL
jgi:hypothetical protein